MRRSPTVALLFFACFLFVACGSQKVVLVGSDDTYDVAAFQLDGTIQGTELIPKTQSTDRALLVQDDGEVGYVGGRSGTLFAVDLTTSSPTLKTGSSSGQPGFVTLSNEITDIAQANPILLVTAGPGEGSNRGATVSSVLSGPMNEADVLNFGPAGTSGTIDVCDDQSTVLVAFRGGGKVRKLTVGPQGSLTDTGASFQPPLAPTEIECAPGSQAGIVVGTQSPAGPGPKAQTFTTANMNVVETLNLAAASSEKDNPIGHSAEFNASGSAVFVFSSAGDPTTPPGRPVGAGGNGFVERIAFNASTGGVGSRMETTVAPAAHPTVGIDLLDLGPDGQRLYVTQPANDEVLILDPTNLSIQGSVRGTVSSPIAIDSGGS
jgi:hypothetical protein